MKKRFIVLIIVVLIILVASLFIYSHLKIKYFPGVCTYEEADGFKIDAACNQLTISFDAENTEEIRSIIHEHDGKIIDKILENFWLVYVPKEEKLYQLKEVLDQKEGVSAGFNMITVGEIGSG
ncbi:MAG: hypothetical protein KAT77_01475 [Nanoarchaeota archaeon]|nr:hypothetical protein [Nanoarchaeota archaeon]